LVVINVISRISKISKISKTVSLAPKSKPVSANERGKGAEIVEATLPPEVTVPGPREEAKDAPSTDRHELRGLVIKFRRRDGTCEERTKTYTRT